VPLDPQAEAALQQLAALDLHFSTMEPEAARELHVAPPDTHGRRLRQTFAV
jgi:hypothetical protein